MPIPETMKELRARKMQILDRLEEHKEGSTPLHPDAFRKLTLEHEELRKKISRMRTL